MKSKIASYIKIFLLSIVYVMAATSCDEREEPMVQTPDDILGVWTNGEGIYLKFQDDYTVFDLTVEEMITEDGESMTLGEWVIDAYLYEPGYNLVIYLDRHNNAEVYKLVSLNENEFTWCLVDDIRDRYESGTSIGHVLGDIIKEAQKGYEVNYDLLQNYTKISNEDFEDILDNLDALEEWFEW